MRLCASPGSDSTAQPLSPSTVDIRAVRAGRSSSRTFASHAATSDSNRFFRWLALVACSGSSLPVKPSHSRLSDTATSSEKRRMARHTFDRAVPPLKIRWSRAPGSANSSRKVQQTQKSFSTNGALKPNSCAAALNSSRRCACVSEMTLFVVWLSPSGVGGWDASTQAAWASGRSTPTWCQRPTVSAIARPVDAPDQTIAFALGGRVADGNPAAGAGRLEAAGAEDHYLFTASQGQLAFFAPSGVVPAFKGALRWQLIKPSGGTVFASFFSNPQGRTLLPETGEYRIRVYTDGTDPSWLGWYGFEVLALPPDQTFAYSIGTPVTNGVPQTGAGHLEVAGAEDNYLFTASAGQVVFFQSLTQDPTFKGGLRWQLADPAGGTVFSCLFNNPQGRVILGKAGQYRIRIFTDGREPGAFGIYSFSTRSDVADQQFAIQVGQLVSDSRPAPGAGRIETPGSEDTYTFAHTEHGGPMHAGRAWRPLCSGNQPDPGNLDAGHHSAGRPGRSHSRPDRLEHRTRSSVCSSAAVALER